MRVRALIGSGFGVGLLLLGGCAYGEVRQVVRAHFASEFDCPEVLLKKRELWYSYEGPDQFKAIGCGHVRTYTCPDKGMISYDDKVCTFVEGDADAPKTVAMTPEGEEDLAPPMDDMGGGDEGTTGGEDTGGEDTGGDDSGGSTDGDVGGDLDSDAEGSSAPSSSGAASGSSGAAGGTGKAGGKVKLGIGK